jgi:hypothetical protein
VDQDAVTRELSLSGKTLAVFERRRTEALPDRTSVHRNCKWRVQEKSRRALHSTAAQDAPFASGSPRSLLSYFYNYLLDIYFSVQ